MTDLLARLEVAEASGVTSERFTGELRWLAGDVSAKLQQRVEVTSYGPHGHATERTYEWRDVPTEVAAARQQSPEKEPG